MCICNFLMVSLLVTNVQPANFDHQDRKAYYTEANLLQPKQMLKTEIAPRLSTWKWRIHCHKTK